MTYRVVLREPSGSVSVRDVVHGAWADPSGDVELILGEGLWALPGLVDAHGHLATDELRAQPGDMEGAMARARDALAAGVTLILDKGWTDDTVARMTESMAQDDRPDIESAATIITAVGGYLPGFTREVESSFELSRAVSEGSISGGGWVKLIGDWPRPGLGPMPNFSSDDLEMAVTLASGMGARVAIHTMAREVPTMAVAAGVHSIEHGLFLMPDDLALLGSRRGMWVPTVMRVEAVITQLGSGSSGGKLLAEGLTNIGRLLNDAVDAGVHVLAGTDLIGSSSSVAAEALKLLEHGLSVERMLDAVAGSGLRATGRPDDFGLGSPADAVLFPENPLNEPGVLAHPQVVIRRGRIL